MFNKLFSFNIRLFYLIFAAAAVFAAIAMVSYSVIKDGRDASARSQVSGEIIQTSGDIQSIVKELSLARRGYLLTSDDEYVRSIDVQEPDVYGKMSILRKLAANDETQLKRIDAYFVIIRQRLKNISISVKLFSTNTLNGEIQNTYTRIGFILHREQNRLFGEIKEHEETKLEFSRAEERTASDRLEKCLIIGYTLALVLVLISFIYIRRFRKQKNLELSKRLLKEEELKERRSELEAITNLAPVGIFHTDTFGNCNYVNNRMCQMTGYLSAEVFDKGWIKLIHPEDRGQVFEKWDKAMEVSGEFREEFRYMTKKGKVLHVICQAVARVNENSDVTGYTGSVIDVTDLHDYREELIKYNRLFEGISEGIPDPICVKDSGGRYEFINTAGAKQLGLEREEVIGKFDHELISKKIVSDVIDRDREIMKEGNTVTYELSSVYPDGGLKTYLATKGVIRNSRNRVTGMFSVYRDITKFKNEEEQIKKSLKEKETLLKEIHHRVKNNLQIAASLLRLQSGYVKDEESRQYFQDSQNRIRSMAIVHEKLYGSDNFEKIELKMYVNRLVDDLIDSLNVNRRIIEVITDIDDINLELDQSIPIGLIINEIITNSLKYAFPSGRKGRVIVKISRDINTGELYLNIHDNGIGLPEGLDPQELNSLGMQLIYSLVEGQLSGKVTLNGKNGTKYEIIIPPVLNKQP